MALTLCGTSLVIWNPNGVTISNGLMFVVLSSAAGSLGAILMKQIKGVQALQFQAWAGLSAILPLGLASGPFRERTGVDHPCRRPEAPRLRRLLSALVVSVIAHTAYYWLINRYEANMIAPLILMSPVFTVVLGVLLLGDRLDLRMIVGAAITLIGVLIIALRPNRVMPRALLIRERM